MQYARKEELTGTVTDHLADNENIAYLHVPAGTAVTVYNAEVIIQTADTTGGRQLEFVEVTNADTVWMLAATDGSDDTIVQMTPQAGPTGGTTFPFDIPVDNTNARIFAAKVNGVPDAGTLYGFNMKYSQIDE